MSGFLKNILNQQEPAPRAGGDDTGFEDFGAPPAPPVVSVAGTSAVTAASASTSLSASTTASPNIAANAAPLQKVPYTAWWRVWERTKPSDFLQEAFILPIVIVMLFAYVWGSRKNRRRAQAFGAAHLPVLQEQFAVVGYDGTPTVNLPADQLAMREKGPGEYTAYATGRQNVACFGINLQMLKRYNPLLFLVEHLMPVFFDSFPEPVERAEITAYAFDGKEKSMLVEEGSDGEELDKIPNSTYDGFVFAIVHKSMMRKLREDRYDVSLTTTKGSNKLPDWVTVMSESAEITDMVVTKELASAVEQAGDELEFLLITDQPFEKPSNVEETRAKKRVILSLRLPSGDTAADYSHTQPLFHVFLGLTDHLVVSAHFRQEIARKLRTTRDEELRRLVRHIDDEKTEERKVQAEKLKREERDRLLRGMSADEQRKYLEKEKERENKRLMKKGTIKM